MKYLIFLIILVQLCGCSNGPTPLVTVKTYTTELNPGIKPAIIRFGFDPMVDSSFISYVKKVDELNILYFKNDRSWADHFAHKAINQTDYCLVPGLRRVIIRSYLGGQKYQLPLFEHTFKEGHIYKLDSKIVLDKAVSYLQDTANGEYIYPVSYMKETLFGDFVEK